MHAVQGRTDETRPGKWEPTGSRAAALIAAILTVGVLYLARPLLIPFALAILFSFVLSPLVARVQRWGLRRWPAVLLVVALSLSGLGALGWLVAVQAGGLVGDLPSYRENIVKKAVQLRRSWGGSFGEAQNTFQEIRKEIATTPATGPATSGPGMSHAAPGATVPVASAPGSEWRRLLSWGSPFDAGRPDNSQAEPVAVRIEPGADSAVRLLGAILGPFVGPLLSMGLATVLVVFLLGQREELRDRVIWLVGRAHLSVTTEALSEAARRLSRYLLVQVLVNVSHGVAIAGGLGLIGVPRALLWGLLAALLRFVPFIGTWIAAGIPILLSLAVFDDWLRPALVAGLFLCIDLASAYLLEPWLYGARAGVTPIAIFVSAICWTWLWGGIGLFLATPLTVCLVVIGRYVPQLEFLAVLLSDHPALPPYMRLYQRLLARDEVGAEDWIREARRGLSPAEFQAAIILPVLREAAHDRARGTLQGEREEFVEAAVQRLITGSVR